MVFCANIWQFCGRTRRELVVLVAVSHLTDWRPCRATNTKNWRALHQTSKTESTVPTQQLESRIYFHFLRNLLQAKHYRARFFNTSKARTVDPEANLPNQYSALCWRPVTHVQTWATYSTLYRFGRLSDPKIDRLDRLSQSYAGVQLSQRMSKKLSWLIESIVHPWSWVSRLEIRKLTLPKLSNSNKCCQ